jgi:thiol-disulfide isomerase/thioredoxin
VPLPVLVSATVLVVVAVAAFVVTRDGGGAEASADWPSASKVKATELTALTAPADTRIGDLLGGKPLVVNFFARTCQPCRKEMPAFQRVYDDVQDEVGLVGVSEDVTEDDARTMVEQTGVTFPTYLDGTLKTLLLFGGNGLPTTVFIAPDGRVVDVSLGKLDAGQLRHEIEANFGIDA